MKTQAEVLECFKVETVDEFWTVLLKGALLDVDAEFTEEGLEVGVKRSRGSPMIVAAELRYEDDFNAGDVEVALEQANELAARFEEIESVAPDFSENDEPRIYGQADGYKDSPS